MAKGNELGKSKYAKKVAYRRTLSGGRGYTTTNEGRTVKLPIPLPLFQDA